MTIVKNLIIPRYYPNADYVEPLPREMRKLVETAVIELTKHLRQPAKNEPVALTPLQKVFLRLFR